MGFPNNKRGLFLNIWRNPRFIAEFVKEWKIARRGTISDEVLKGIVARRSRHIRPAALRDLAIWKNTNRSAFWTPCWPADAHDFDTSIEHLSQYLVSRAQWIDANVDAL